MSRRPRIVIPGLPHHITQRGNRRQATFFCDDDYRLYLDLMSEWCDRCAVEVWAWCLMTNHIHLVAVPQSEQGLRRAIGEAHRRYTSVVNRREGWTGHLWQGRFSSFVMDPAYTLAAVRYVELNPVDAKMVGAAEEYPWSSARAHLAGRDDVLVRVAPMLSRVADWGAFLGAGVTPEVDADLRRHEVTGRPLGSDDFVDRLESQVGRVLRPRTGGRPLLPVGEWSD